VINEGAVERELADQGIDLDQRERERWTALDVLADEAIGEHADVHGRLGGVIHDGDAVLLRERQDAENLPDAVRAGVRLDVPTDGADVRAGRGGAREQRHRRGRRARRAIGLGNTMLAPRGPQVLSEELPGLRVHESDMQIVPLHGEALANPPGRCAVVRGVHLDTAIEMDGPRAEAVVAKRLDGERPEGGPLFGKHHADLSFRRPVNARVRPARFPAIEVALCLLDRVEAQPLEWRLLRMAARLPPCLCDRDRAPDTATPRRRSARARRDTTD